MNTWNVMIHIAQVRDVQVHATGPMRDACARNTKSEQFQNGISNGMKSAMAKHVQQIEDAKEVMYQ